MIEQIHLDSLWHEIPVLGAAPERHKLSALVVSAVWLYHRFALRTRMPRSAGANGRHCRSECHPFLDQSIRHAFSHLHPQRPPLSAAVSEGVVSAVLSVAGGTPSPSSSGGVPFMSYAGKWVTGFERAAYRGGCRSLPELPKGTIRHGEDRGAEPPA
jgi:hypothetical protein